MTTIVVNDNSDLAVPGPGLVTLRSAINTANITPTITEIRFIPSITTITIGSALPTITSSNLSINLLAPDNSPSNQITVTKNSNTFNIFTIQSLSTTIRNMTINSTNVTPGIGHGITCILSTVNLTNVIVTNHVSNQIGAGILCTNTILTLDTCTISGNRSINVSGSGGGVYFTNTTLPASVTLTITNSTFSLNTATVSGGGLLCNNAQAIIQNCNFTNNSVLSAASNGGGVYVTNTVAPATNTLTMTNCNFSFNTSNNSGGALYMIRVISVLQSCTFQLNTTSTDGGALYMISVISVLQSCTFQLNTTNTDGGGIFSINSTFEIIDSTIDSNKATVNGGGIYNQDSSIDINNSTISNNTSTSGPGAGLYNINGTISITASTFSGNNTNTNVAGVAIYSDGILNMLNSTVGEHVAPGANSIIFFPLGSLQTTITNCTIANNTGIGVQSLTANTSLVNTIVALNTVDTDGTFTSLGNNLIMVNNSASFVNGVNGDKVGIVFNPLLQPLADNGGPTQTYALTQGSPAINAGNNAAVAGVPFDQRGSPFVRIFGGTVDIGSYEFIPSFVCYAADSQIYTFDKNTGNIAYVPAADVKSNIHKVYDVDKHKFIDIIYNIKSGPVDRMIFIPKDLLGENKPHSDFHVTSGHQIVIDGAKVKARDIVGGKRIRVDPQPVYSICVSKTANIDVNGLDVKAYSVAEWTEYAKKKMINWVDN